MRIRLLLALLLVPAYVCAQESLLVRGRIVNERGEAVEYVQVGVPKLQIGTISDAYGRFEINLPADTLQFHHVSYETAFYSVTRPAEDVLIVMKEQELQPAVFIGGDTREKYLLRAGTRIPGAVGDFNCTAGAVRGGEMGAVARARKPFLIKDILFSVKSNSIPGCVASVNIYRIEGDPEEFINILHRPIYVSIPVSDENQDFDIEPEDIILLEPGRYFISFNLVDYDNGPDAMHLLTPLYFKDSYQRLGTMGKLIRIPVNIGIAVKGLEYK